MEKCVWLWLKHVRSCFNVFTTHSQPLFDVKTFTNVQIKDTHNWSVSYLHSPFFFYEHKLLQWYINTTGNINTDSINGSAAIGIDKAEQTDYYRLQ